MAVIKIADLLEKYPYIGPQIDRQELLRYTYALGEIERLDAYIGYILILFIMVSVNVWIISIIVFKIVIRHLKKEDNFSWPWNKCKKNPRGKMEANCEANQSTSQRTKSTATILKVE